MIAVVLQSLQVRRSRQHESSQLQACSCLTGRLTWRTERELFKLTIAFLRDNGQLHFVKKVVESASNFTDPLKTSSHSFIHCFPPPASRRILQSIGSKRLASEASAGNCSPSPTPRKRGLVNKRRRVILSQDSEDEQPVSPLPLVEVSRAFSCTSIKFLSRFEDE